VQQQAGYKAKQGRDLVGNRFGWVEVAHVQAQRTWPIALAIRREALPWRIQNSRTVLSALDSV
jgi:hypothetical protein